MSIHQGGSDKVTDGNYIKGNLEYLVIGNRCRLLDGRRTEGFIEEIFLESGIFRWRITNYEDKGNYWDVDFENIGNYQFESFASKATSDRLKMFQKKVEQYNKFCEILIDRNKQEETMKEVDLLSKDIVLWINEKLSGNSKTDINIDVSSKDNNKCITRLLNEYMISIGCLEQESLTAKSIVLNPDSGEWFKGILIVMAKLGLINYYGKITRTKDVFEGFASVEKRSKYIIHRLAFLQAIFDINNIEEVTLYRGMSSERRWINKKRSILHMSFSKEVAEEFSDLRKESRFTTSYIIKMNLPINNLFMTYIETSDMNQRYKELEAIVIGDVEYTI